MAIGSGRDNAAAICRGADPEILASTSRDAADDAWTLGVPARDVMVRGDFLVSVFASWSPMLGAF